jgi:hypothetical protein
MRRLVLLLAIFMCGAVYAYAGPTEYTFVNWNGGDWQNGYPYYITQTDGPVGQIYAVMCDDYVHGGAPGDTWYANTTNLGSENLSLARFNNIAGPNALYPLELYDEAGWILLQTQVEQTSQWKDMNSAVWTIFDPSAPCDSTCQSWITTAEQQERIGFPGTNFSRVYILTPEDQHDPDPNSMQEFMYIGQATSGQGAPANQTPEPGTFLLVGTGALALFRRRIF